MRFLQTFVLIALLASAPVVVAATVGESVSISQSTGDLNFDRQIDISDVMLLGQYLSGGRLPAGTSLRAMDVNHDGFIDVADLAVLSGMVFANPTAPIPAPPPTRIEFVRGDLDGNGIVDRADYRLLEFYLEFAHTFPAPPDAADVNGDGRIDKVDLDLLWQHVFGGEYKEGETGGVTS